MKWSSRAEAGSRQYTQRVGGVGESKAEAKDWKQEGVRVEVKARVRARNFSLSAALSRAQMRELI